MPSRKKPKAAVTEHEIDGHKVRIERDGEREQLWIDGKRRRFFTNSGGYVLSDNAYVPARSSLLEAVRDYVGQLRPAAPDELKGRM